MKKQTEPNEYWTRIEAVIRRNGGTAAGLARQLGYARAEVLYQIKKGRNRISLQLAERIVACYPEISKCWLLCGEGEMLRGEHALHPACFSRSANH